LVETEESGQERAGEVEERPEEEAEECGSGEEDVDGLDGG
jgi:hypothetical protein